MSHIKIYHIVLEYLHQRSTALTLPGWQLWILDSHHLFTGQNDTNYGTQCPNVFNLHLEIKTVIIDCFEIFIERPTNLLARAQTFSSYKHHNTIKVLIGITPQGTISFLSNAWGGTTSDKYLTENCGLLN